MTEKIIVSAEDTETTWNYSKYHIGDWIEMYTTDKMMMKRYEKFTNAHPDQCRIVAEDQYSMTFSINPKCMGFYPHAIRKVTMSEEEKQQRSERMKQLRQKQLAQD